MFGGLAFLVGGNMSVSASGQGGLLLRVDPAETDALAAKPHAGPFEMRGRAMDGWLRVDPEGLKTKRQLEPWVRRGVAYARSLPPKKAKKRSPTLVPGAAEQLQEQQEQVEDVEEDSGRDRYRLVLRGAPQPVEVDQRVAGEDRDAGQRVERARAVDLEQDEDQAEDDQAEQAEEQRSVEVRQVAPRRVAPGAHARHGETGGAGRLPDHGRLVLRIPDDGHAHRQPKQEADREQQRQRDPGLPALVRDVQADDANERTDPRDEELEPGEVAARVGAKRGEPAGDRHEKHDPPEQRACGDALEWLSR